MKQIQLIGHIGKDAELKKAGDDNFFTVFNVAVSEKVKGEDVTTWFEIIKSGKNENLLSMLVKGAKVFVQGNLTPRQTEVNGKTYLNLNVSANMVWLVGSKADAQHTAQAQPVTAQPVATSANEGSDLPF